MIAEPPVPKQLQKIQRWFASIIVRPIDIDNRMHPISPKGHPMDTEAALLIAPSLSLSSAQRMEIYNQQYWWRLFSILHESFPFLLRLFGKFDFNEKIGAPYLARYIPNHWSLNRLGVQLPYWIRRYYKGEDKRLVTLAAEIDNAYTDCFIAPNLSPVTPQNLETLMDVPLYLQPHINLFFLDYKLLEFRDRMMEENPEYWIDHDFPELAKQKSGYMVWRDSAQNVGWISLETAEIQLLKQFKKGISFNNLCDWLEKQPSSLYNAASQNLDQWTRRWVVNEWITPQII